METVGGFEKWLQNQSDNFSSLSNAVAATLVSLTTNHSIAVLSVSPRVKSIEKCLEKAKRKGYRDPKKQMTDISGIRVVVYFEEDVKKVSNIIYETFEVDEKNSVNLDDARRSNEVGYRSSHFVCLLGQERIKLPEFSKLKGLKFEIQIRTVLQHAWAEIAHDRSYKFPAELPRNLERKLFLLAGLLETADAGFNELVKAIDDYRDKISSNDILLGADIDAISLQSFVKKWEEENDILLETTDRSDELSEVVSELRQLGVTKIKQLEDIVPASYAQHLKYCPTNIFGAVRDWMMISDPERFVKNVKVKWILDTEGVEQLRKIMPSDSVDLIEAHVGSEDFTDFPDDEISF